MGPPGLEGPAGRNGTPGADVSRRVLSSRNNGFVRSFMYLEKITQTETIQNSVKLEHY